MSMRPPTRPLALAPFRPSLIHSSTNPSIQLSTNPSALAPFKFGICSQISNVQISNLKSPAHSSINPIIPAPPLRYLCCLLLNAALALSSPAADWQSGNGFRSQALTVPASGKAGFTLLPPELTGIRFTNSLSLARQLQNSAL
jgi:hypothetical protein